MTAKTERRIKLTLHYDGSDFFGWQAQPDSRTVQAELEAAIARLTVRPTPVMAAGRTDRGVHAVGQIASAVLPASWTPETLRRALNAVLPPDIWVAAAEEADLAFHARFHAVARSYFYRVGTEDAARSPFHRRWCWPLSRPLDVAALARAAKLLPGEHSFRSFAKAGQPARGERCIVEAARWTEWPGLGLEFHITANRFLHHMVRYLVGTMVEIGQGRRDPADLAALLAGTEHLETSPPAPAKGLFLAGVRYGETSNMEERE